jgi:hypothetical protein
VRIEGQRLHARHDVVEHVPPTAVGRGADELSSAESVCRVRDGATILTAWCSEPENHSRA